MKVDAHIIAWNESETIRFTIEHYKKYCRNIYIYDNYSDDGTDNIAEELGCIVKQFGTPGQLNDQHYLNVKNNCWKDSDADWVIVCDADEIIYHEHLNLVLKQERLRGTTIMITQGYGMYSESMPVKSFLDIKTGVRDNKYSKSAVFNPDKLKEIGYIFGCHEARPKGSIHYSENTIALLHYKHIGGVKRVIDRYAQYKKRLSEINLKWGLGKQYSMPDEMHIKWFQEHFKRSKTLSEHGIL